MVDIGTQSGFGTKSGAVYKGKSLISCIGEEE